MPTNRTMIPFVCQRCGVTFEAISKGKKSKARRFCSRTCTDQHKRINPVTMYHHRVVKQDGCWDWRGKTDRRGYPFFELKRDDHVVTYRAHRLSYEIHVGPIPEGLNILHHCDNPPCTRPDHLFTGTTRDNTDDKVAKERQARGASLPQAKLTENQVVEIIALLREPHRKWGRYTRIGRLLQIRNTIIRDIDLGLTWKHVPRH